MSREILFYSDFPFGYHNPEAEEKMSRFAARGYRVHYVEQLGIRNPTPRHVVRLARQLTRRGPSDPRRPFDVISPKLVPPRRAPLVDGFNRAWLKRQLRSRLDDPAEAILWVRYATPELVPFVEETPSRLVVYEAVDDHERAPAMTQRLSRAFRAAEDRLLAKAGLVFAWSEPIRDRLSDRHGNVVLAPAAVDVDAFAHVAAADPSAPPTAVYVGAIDSRFDSELVSTVAELLEGWAVVLAGPVLSGASPLRVRPPNLTLLGRIESHEVPAVLERASVCLMPYRRNSFTETLFPIKLVEYLAAGKPIVSTSIQASREFADVVEIADHAGDFADAVRAAGTVDSPELRRRRIERARPFSWERRIDDMDAAIRKALACA